MAGSSVSIDRDLLSAVAVALRSSASVHNAERIPFSAPLVALAEALEAILRPGVARVMWDPPFASKSDRWVVTCPFHLMYSVIEASESDAVATARQHDSDQHDVRDMRLEAPVGRLRNGR